MYFQFEFSHETHYIVNVMVQPQRKKFAVCSILFHCQKNAELTSMPNTHFYTLCTIELTECSVLPDTHVPIVAVQD